MAGITTTIDHTLEEAQKHRTAAAASPAVSSVPLTSAKLESGLRDTLWRFVHEECIPAERVYAEYMAEVPHKKRFAVHPPIMETLKSRARELGLWNLWMTDEYPQSTTGLTLSEYAPLAEIMGRSFLASEACNCSAPDTGNMEVLAKYGSPAQQASWLRPLLDGSIRSAFLMTEPAVASSDARNICTTMHRDGDEYVVNGTKWWSTGACNPRCKVAIVSTSPPHPPPLPAHAPMRLCSG